MIGISGHHASHAVEATALLIDLRNFTPNLKASRPGPDGIDRFCSFLAEFHALCIDAGLLSLPSELRDSPPLHASSTGDGLIMVFMNTPRHYAHGFLTSLVLHRQLSKICERYNQQDLPENTPPLSFGIGVESGQVTPIRAGQPDAQGQPTIHTVLGNCINIASRAQGLTKQLAFSRTIVAARTTALLSEALLETDYQKLQQISADNSTPDAIKHATEEQMATLNRQLCLRFLHLHHLRGVDEPVPLFRVSESALNIENESFTTLLAMLTDHHEHMHRVMAAFSEDVRESLTGS